MPARLKIRALRVPPRHGHEPRSMFSFAIISLLFLQIIFRATANGPFLRPECTVILLSGLPGDLESESSYNQELHSWLQLLEIVHPKQIIALADNPESIGPARDGLSRFSASRSNFLATASVISSSTNPLVVIVWGHGGKQGDTPVFHVRGPRITPGDLSAFAENTRRPASQWVLCFRGSGYFASKLMGEGRQILSSESDRIFNSDPVEMSSILKVLHENPAIDLEAFADAIGRATAEWYKQRNLARTEEPTLWLANQKPRLLAATSQEDAPASVDASLNSSAKTTNEVAKEITPNAAKTNSDTDLLPIWKELKQVAPQNYPDSDAVLLRRRISYTLAANPAVVAEHDEFVQILTAEGKRYGEFDVSYSPPSEEISFSECEVLSPQGKLIRLNPDAIRESNEESLGDYQAGHRKFFSLPGVVPGAVLHVRYRKEWKKFPLPHVSLQIPISSEIPSLESILQVTVPRDEPFHFAVENFSTLASDASSLKVDPVINQTSYGATYSWQFTNLLAESREMLAPPVQGISLLVSTFPDWSDFAEWYGRVSRLADEMTPQINSKALELTHEAKTEREKIQRVYNYVTGLRYVAVPLGVNSFRPHAAANVFQNQFGDCKDKANLFNTMLHCLNIDANLVLVPRFRQAYDALPGFAFNHAISRVCLPDETLWVDTTDDICRFGMLPPGDSGRKVLVIAAGTNSLTQLPAPQASQHKLTIRGQVDCSQNPDSLPTVFDVLTSGYVDYELRESAREAREHAASIPLLSLRYRLSSGSFALEKQKSTAVAALDENFSWHAEGTSIGICHSTPNKSAGGPIQQSVCAPFWLPKEWDLALHRRHAPLFLNQGYPLIVDESVAVKLPVGARALPLPDPIENEKDPLRWKIEWTKTDGGTIAASFHAALRTGELSSAETSAFRDQLRALVQALNAAVPY